MGYCMNQKETKFKIARVRHSPALDALRAAFPGEAETLGACSTLGKALEAFRWEAEFDPAGDIVGIVFQGEKIAEEDDLFAALAPFVEADSFIAMIGEDDSLWRWYFDGKTVVSQPGRVVYDQP